MPVSNEDFEEISFLLLLGALLVAFLSLVLGLVIFWIAIIAIFVLMCGFGIYVIRASFFLGVGLIVLSLTPWFSIMASLGTIGEYYRVVILVEHNPNYHISAIRLPLLLGVLPVTIGLALCIIGFLRNRKILSTILGRLFLLVLGVGSLFFGSIYCFETYRDYSSAIAEAQQENISYIIGSLQMVYAPYFGIGLLWLITGFAFIAMSVYTLQRLRNPDTSKDYAVQS